MLARFFAVMAALCLVGALALGTLGPPGQTLGQGLLMLDHDSTTWLREHSVAWLWNWIEVPLMIRPLWLIPACIGVICAGMATSLSLGDASPRRRRS